MGDKFNVQPRSRSLSFELDLLDLTWIRPGPDPDPSLTISQENAKRKNFNHLLAWLMHNKSEIEGDCRSFPSFWLVNA